MKINFLNLESKDYFRMERENTHRYMNMSSYTTHYINPRSQAKKKKVVLGCVIPSKSVVNIL